MAQRTGPTYASLRVMLHVDPRDPARSVLRGEDIDAALAQTPTSGD